MVLLKLIQDKPLPVDESGLETRGAARAVLFDEQNLIPLLFVAKLGYHKLPGVGIELGENKEQAFIREIREEVGCEIDIDGEIGQIVEYRSQFNLIQTSYCYWGKVKLKGTPQLKPDEVEEGFETLWVTLDQAIELISRDHPGDYEGKFIVDRDYTFLSQAKLVFRSQTGLKLD